MSETQSPLFNRRTCGLLIAGASFFMLIFFGCQRPSTAPILGDDTPLPVRRVDVRVRAFDSASYYRPILAYNLFRPLGWTPPIESEPYRLIGTILARDANTPPKVIIETTAGKTTYIVTTGDPLSADTEVGSIQPKQVTLSTNGQQRSISLNAALWIH